MSLTTLIVGIGLQLLFALVQFMGAIFAGAGAANTANLKPWQITTLDLSILVLPSISVIVSALLAILYMTESQYLSNWWHVVPCITFVLYLAFAFSLGGN